MFSNKFSSLVSLLICQSLLPNRYSWSRDKFVAMQLQEGMRRQALYQGTDMERKIKSEFEQEELDVKEA